MKHGRPDRLAQIETFARTLARSGEYAGPHAIEIALFTQFEGDEVHKVFGNRWTQVELQRICERATQVRRPKAA